MLTRGAPEGVGSVSVDTAELVARLRSGVGSFNPDVSLAADRLEELQKIANELTALVELVAADCGKPYEDRPSLYQRGPVWRYHQVRAANKWNDAATPLAAAAMLDRGRVKADKSNGCGCSPKDVVEGIVAKWRCRYTYDSDFAHTARSKFFHRYELSVDTAGGSYTAGWFRTKTELHLHRRRHWHDRSYEIYDTWSWTDPEVLADTKALAKHLGWRRYSNIHEAPLSLS